ncbi:MAG TPA: pyridoxal-phosphate dependent enzyme, partial [Chthoniobacterales bacterium]
QTTGPEIWNQMKGRVDAIVVGVGSSGTLTGLSRYFARVAPACEIILADPEGSVLTGYVRERKIGTAGSWLVEGIGEDFLPEIADFSRVTAAYSVSDAESFQAARELLKHEGIFGGSSSGTLFASALRYCRKQTSPKRVVTFACDSGNKYLSKMYSDVWMADQGFLPRTQNGDLRDLISRRYQDGTVVAVGPTDTLLTAFNRMRIADVSQMPVLADGKLVGILDESDLLGRVQDGAGSFRDPVRMAMTDRVETLQVGDPLSSVRRILDDGKAAIVLSGEEFVGLVTRIDLLNFLRRKI